MQCASLLSLVNFRWAAPWDQCLCYLGMEKKGGGGGGVCFLLLVAVGLGGGWFFWPTDKQVQGGDSDATVPVTLPC